MSKTKQQREEEAQKWRAQMELARPIGEALGDGWKYDDHACDEYKREEAAHALAEKLTPDQMRTLAGWLGVELPK